MDNQKNLLIAVFLCVAILFGFNYFFQAPPPHPQEASVYQTVQQLPSTAPTQSISHTDALNLTHYHQTVDPQSPQITLLSASTCSQAYYARFGWAPLPHTATPTEHTRWQTQDTALTEQTPVTLSWDNGQGLLFQQTISVDNKVI